MVRSGGPLAVRPLNTVTPPQRAVVAAKEPGPVVSAILADEESTDEEEVLRIKLGNIFAEPMRPRPCLRLVDEEEEEEEETKETEETGEEERTSGAEEGAKPKRRTELNKQARVAK